MTHYQASLRDIHFALFELLDYEQHCNAVTHIPLEPELVQTFFNEAARFAEEQVAPLNAVGDQQGCQLRDGMVTTPDGFKAAYEQFCASGWPTLTRTPAYGGQGLPQSLGVVINEIIGTPNWAWGMYAGLSQGAMHTIEVHGTDQQKQQYLPPLISGQWTGTMCLTEAHCGSDLGLLRTKAEPQADGTYRITGNKIFISSGDHDMADNIVHIVLARLPDAPSGTRGISLFIVPKILIDDESHLREPNKVLCTALEHKMGIHGNATCELSFEGATGFLLGELNKGLAHMFTFMNMARIGTALQGLAHAELGYQHARTYARERLQMRSLSGVKNPEAMADPIIVHPDVRRMLLTQKALVEGVRMLIYYTSLYADKPQVEGAQDRLGLLTPIAKAFCTEVGFESANLALQCFGGHGYIRDWGLEQNLRDCRIASLYEGTTGIQALDLLGRKVLGSGGAILQPLLQEIEHFCRTYESDAALSAHVAQLTTLNQEWKDLTQTIAERSAHNLDEIGAASVDYLMYSGYLVVGYLWLRAHQVALQRIAKGTTEAQFYRAKIMTADFYYARILPRSKTLAATIRSGADNVMAMASEDF